MKFNGNNDSSIQTVLICDENPALRKSVCASLKNEQVKVIEASNGQQALEQFFKYLPDGHCQLIEFGRRKVAFNDLHYILDATNPIPLFKCSVSKCTIILSFH